MQFERLSIPEVVAVVPVKHDDARGFFSETYRSDRFAEVGIASEFVQDNHAYSAKRGALRGLHFQIPPHAQGKLVRCVRGSILDVAVDIRRGSPSFGRHVVAELSAANWKQLWIPPGFAHGYLTLENDCEVVYKVTDFYAPTYERGIAWNDADLAIDWRLPEADISVSKKDRGLPKLKEMLTFQEGEA